MNEDPSSYEQDVSDLDTARLALRGAVASLRNLQDLMTTLKAENQELVVREKAWKARVETMEMRLTEIHARWQQSQTLMQDYKQEISSQLRQSIAVEEQEKWQAQMVQVQTLLQEWQKAREIREAELARVKDKQEERDRDVQRLEKEKISLEQRTQQELASIMERSRHHLKESLDVAEKEKERELRDVKAQWAKEAAELKESVRRMEAERVLREEEIRNEFHKKRNELEVLWREREAEAWKQMEAGRTQTEATMKALYNTRLGAIERERQEMQAAYEQKLSALESSRLEKEKAMEGYLREKEAQVRERYQTSLQDKESKIEVRRLELEQTAARKEAELLSKFRREEETMRNSIKLLESSLRRTMNEEMNRRKAALKNSEPLAKEPPAQQPPAAA